MHPELMVIFRTGFLLMLPERCNRARGLGEIPTCMTTHLGHLAAICPYSLHWKHGGHPSESKLGGLGGRMAGARLVSSSAVHSVQVVVCLDRGR